jgi:hypothetical protein
LRRRSGFGRAQQSQFSLKCVRLACFCFCGLSRFYHIDPNRDALLRFNLMDRNGAICAIENPFNQTALRIPRTISKLWHRRGKVIGNRESQNCNLASPQQRDVLFESPSPRKKFYLSCCRNLIRAPTMRCATVIIVVSIAFASQAFAVLRPLFPAKASPPFGAEAIVIGKGSIQHSAKQAPPTAPKK